MKNSIAVALFFLFSLVTFLSGCGFAHRHLASLRPLNAHEAACRRANYCSPQAGEVMIGDRICYTDNVFTENPIDNRDLKCLPGGHW